MTFEVPRGPGPIETLRTRAEIESKIAALAATERKDSDLDRLFSALRDAGKHKRQGLERDRCPQVPSGDCAGGGKRNAPARGDHDVGQLARRPVVEKIEEHSHTSALRAASQEDHQRIFSAIMAGGAVIVKIKSVSGK